MGDNNQATFPGNDAAAYPPDAAALDKGKGKVVEDPMDVSMDEDEDDSESEAEEQMADDDDDEGDTLEPISTDNIIDGGRRTRGKNIDFQEAAERIREDEMDEDDDDDEDFEPTDNNKVH
ncbi:histone chaperone domain CHZ-domain-containing protein [Aspergillus pseudoustus]|uniref:Histone chaperone domain CHZ-domain-containing protein n=1 Tax=Aspergillus pseudoustus TaxID=1810923 RepID=A0ABR4JZR6_9EURO